MPGSNVGGTPTPSVWLVAAVGEVGSGGEKSGGGDPWVCWSGFGLLSANLKSVGQQQHC